MECRQTVLWRRRIDLDTGAPHTSLRKLTSAVYAPIHVRRGVAGVVYVSSSAVAAELTQPDCHIMGVVAALLSNLDVWGEHRPEGRVFISYSRKDLDAVQRLARHLRRQSISVWFDERLRAGQPWREQLVEAIRNTDAVVLWATPSALASQNVAWEREQAESLGKPIWPILGDTCELPEDLQRIHYLSAREDLELTAAEVAKMMRQHLERA
jgi:hypothetical protein